MNKFNIKSEAQKLKIVEYLLGLGLGELKPHSTENGVCMNVFIKFSCEFNELICKLAKGWKKHSGYHLFPVLAHGENPSDTFDEAFDSDEMWVGQYGDDRRELCLYVADKLEAMELNYE